MARRLLTASAQCGGEVALVISEPSSPKANIGASETAIHLCSAAVQRDTLNARMLGSTPPNIYSHTVYMASG